ncbi:hypothetical protein M4951_14735 [Blastopirellula sp. J2-11]|uniref:hypothetical protein n=1 Tax=Blastopirellula sp. J2-11 TaxID=2943192 RepID=UPI0021CA571B|nr:hypothetical protein [Blastopirellula sp. J2-11]UUO04647.1 hypothetical protein M4951_14735 [Blastopirellula sp. J2-11]
MNREATSNVNKRRRTKRVKPTECPALHQVVAECENEREQRKLYAELKAKGYRCRLLNL